MITRPFLLVLALASMALAGPPLQLEETRSNRFRHNVKEAAISASPRNSDIDASGDWRLNRTVIPLKYTLSLRPILYADDAEAGEQVFTAPGLVEIDTICAEATSEIVLHKHPTLNISSVTVTSTGNNVIGVSSHGYSNEEQQFYAIKLSRSLTVNETNKIIINFVAPVSTVRTAGLYVARYKNEAGDEKLVATTQFEAPDARAAFPCFDEPDMKATFSISLARPKGKAQFTSYANSMRSQNSRDDPALPNWVWDDFQETVKTSTYLVAFVVAEDYSCKETTADLQEGQKPVEVCGPKHLIDNPRNGGDYSTGASAKILKYLEDTYKFPYQMPKMTSIAIPRDYYSAGAMENWGLNTYRDNYLLFYNGESGQANRQSIDSILSHELAHQWFGNLVTCGWWSDIWLNEGFATYVSFLGVQNASDGKFDYVKEMLWDTVQYALNYDVGRDASVINDAKYADEVDTVFGTLTYDKGGSLIRMLDYLMGRDILTAALAEYLEKFQYSNALQNDLFEVLTKHALENGKIPAGTTIKGMMDTWTLQPGYPLVRVSKVGSRYVYMSQERFLTQPRKGDSLTKADKLSLWQIPITYTTSTDPIFENYEPKLWMSNNTLSTSVQMSTNEWLIVNPDGNGFYRVLYDTALLEQIKTVLDSDYEKIGALSRSQLLDDHFSLAKHRYLSYNVGLNLTTYLHLEREHVVWYTVMTDLAPALRMFSNSDVYNFRTYWLSKIEPVLDDIGWTQGSGEEGTKVLLRAKLLDWACSLESRKCGQNAQTILAAWMADKNSVPVDIQPVYYCAMVAQSTTSDLEAIMATIEDPATSAFQRGRLLTALTCSQDESFLKYLLQKKITNNSTVYGESASTIISGIAGSSYGRIAVIDFLTEYYGELVESVGSMSAIISAFSALSSYVNTEGHLDILQKFVETLDQEYKLSDDDKYYLNSYLGTMKNNIEWMEDNYNDMSSWFQEKVQ